MVVLVDTNILMDIIANREPYADVLYSEKGFQSGRKKGVIKESVFHI